jgi:hypothetical protein
MASTLLGSIFTPSANTIFPLAWQIKNSLDYGKTKPSALQENLP